MVKSKEKINKLTRNLKFTWKFTKGARKYLLYFFMFSLSLIVFSAIIPTFKGKQIIYVNNSNWNKLINLTIIIFIFEVLINIFRYFYRKNNQLFYRKTLLNIQMALSEEILKLETEEIDNNTSGLFINRINNDTGGLAVVFENLIDVITEIVTNFGILIAIFLINKKVFLFYVITITILFILNRIRIRRKFKTEKELRKVNEKITGIIGEMIRGLKDIKVLNSEKNFVNKVRKNIEESNDKRYNMLKVDRKLSLLSGSIQDVFDLCFILLGIYLIINSELTIENFVIIYMYKGRLYNLLNYFTSMLEILKDYNLSAERVFSLFDNEEFKKESFGTTKLKKVKGDFEFKNINFSYKENIKIIDNMNFKINANETVAFVGKSGVGKSTIFSLLTRLYHPQSGNILIDGVDINELTKDSIRSNISIITQSPYIFNLSIKDNLKIVKPNLTKEEMINACKNASLHDFIMSLPDKYDTIVGEGGVTLSGGQRQRLAIARAFIRNTEIVLFDEATSALDNETQENIQKAINNLQKTKTILIIAHRLSTVINSDRILLIDEGKIKGEGTHEELLKNNSLYKKLYTSELK